MGPRSLVTRVIAMTRLSRGEFSKPLANLIKCPLDNLVRPGMMAPEQRPKMIKAITLKTDIEIAQDSDAGTAMYQLTPKQRNFVLALVFQTNGNQADAARIAGYECSSDNSFRVQGHSAAHNPKVQAAIQEVVRLAVGADTPAALFAVRQVLFNPNSKTADKLKAAKMLLDKGGLPDKTEVLHSGTVNLSMEDRVREARRRAEALGLDALKILGEASDIPREVIDAEFQIVREKVTGSEGLEDVL